MATIAFTGSVAVGLEIQRRAHAADGQLQIKRIVAELGGKNCVLVDSDVDLDEAVPAIVRSAYGYAGQKCSAAARALVHEAIAGRFAERLAGAVDLLRVGPADDFATEVPALIDTEAWRSPPLRGALPGRGGRGRCGGGRPAIRRAAAGGRSAACRPTRPCFARRSSARC